MKAMTIVVHFEEGQKPEPVGFDSIVCGGKVTALAAYDVIHTMEIAESAIEESDEPRCMSAMEKINTYIVHGIK